MRELRSHPFVSQNLTNVYHFSDDKSAVYPEDSPYWEPIPYQHYIQNFEILKDEVAKSQRKWRVRCLPKFYLIGWLKCGSSDLFSRYNDFHNVM